MSMFLSAEELARLTGRKMKSKQIEVLRQSGVPFYVDASGHPVVPASAIEGRKQAPPAPIWQMPE